MLRIWLVLVALLWGGGSAWAQGGILQSGQVTPGHVGAWAANGVLLDGGSASAGLITSFGVTNSGNGICQNSGPVTSTYTSLCFGFPGGQPTISVGGTSGATSLSININGTTYTLPGSSSCSGCGSIAAQNANAVNLTGGTISGVTISASPIGGVTTVASNAALKALTANISTGVHRAGYSTAGDGGAADYYYSSSACTLNSGAGDNGAQVAPTSGSGCWIMQPPAGQTDIRVWGATASADIGQFVQASYTANVGCIFIPPGIWPWSSATTMNAQPPCFVGAGWNEAVNVVTLSAATNLGTWIHISSSGFTPVLISTQTGQGGVGGFSKIAFYEDQPTPNSAFTPIGYPYIFNILNSGGRVDFENLFFYNTTHCISIVNAARQHIRNISGQPLSTCILFDNQKDKSWVENVDFWPFWSNSNNVNAYTVTQDPIVYQRVDSPFVRGVFALGYHSAFAFGYSTNGVTTGAQLDQIQGDNTLYGIWVEPGAGAVQFQVGSLRGAGEAFSSGILTGSETFRDEGSSTVSSFANIDCFIAGSSCIHIVNSGSTKIANAELWNFNNDNNNSGGLRADTTSSVIALANPPSISNPQNNGPTIQAASSGIYAIRGVRQYWTPRFMGTGGTGTVTYAGQYGTFWYDGSLAVLNFDISTTGALSGFSGNLAIAGIPFNPNEAAGQNTFCTITSAAAVTLTSGYTSMSGVISAGTTSIQILQNAAAANTISLPTSAVGSGAVLQGSCTLSSGG